MTTQDIHARDQQHKCLRHTAENTTKQERPHRNFNTTACCLTTTQNMALVTEPAALLLPADAQHHVPFSAAMALVCALVLKRANFPVAALTHYQA